MGSLSKTHGTLFYHSIPDSKLGLGSLCLMLTFQYPLNFEDITRMEEGQNPRCHISSQVPNPKGSAKISLSRASLKYFKYWVWDWKKLAYIRQRWGGKLVNDS